MPQKQSLKGQYNGWRVNTYKHFISACYFFRDSSYPIITTNDKGYHFFRCFIINKQQRPTDSIDCKDSVTWWLQNGNGTVVHEINSLQNFCPCNNVYAVIYPKYWQFSIHHCFSKPTRIIMCHEAPFWGNMKQLTEYHEFTCRLWNHI